MKKTILVFLIVILLGLFFISAAPKWKTANPCPIKAETNIVYYGDNGFGGVGDLSESWLVNFLEWWKQQDNSINYVELSKSNIQSDCDLTSNNIKVYIQPGGDAYYQQRSLGSTGKGKLINYINSGKGFVGICAGFYYAAYDYYWQNKYYAHSDLLGVYPTVEGSIKEIADYDSNNNYALTPLSNGFNAIYYGGPTRGYRYTSLESPGIVDSSYTAFGEGMPAIIKYNNMLLNSVHLEAYENDGIIGLSTEDRIENYKYLANLINEVSGTNFFVPAYVNPPYCGDNICNGDETYLTCLADCAVPQCNDGIDNDGDGLIDFGEDPGCSSPEDDDERDVVGPIEVFFDGFEDGLDWITYGTGTSWGRTTAAKYEGSYSMGVKRTGAGNPSYTEKSINLNGYGSANIEYYRKLVGLDAADDFSAEYFDGTWKVLEQLGSKSENNADFIKMNFQIPTSATKIRFMCECGAVSEMCYVDNVRIVAQ
jgi:hypothetical protein